eukprot:gene23464-biopygen8866
MCPVPEHLKLEPVRGTAGQRNERGAGRGVLSADRGGRLHPVHGNKGWVPSMILSAKGGGVGGLRARARRGAGGGGRDPRRIHLIPIRPLRAPGVPTSLQFRDGCNPPILLLRIPLGGVLSAADAPPARRLSSISKDHLNYMRGGTPCPPPLTSMSENIIFPALLDQAPWTRPIAAVVEMQTAFSSVGKRGKGDSSHGVGGAIEARGPGVWRDEGVPAAERTGHSRGAGHLCVARAWRELAMFPF